MHSSHLDFFLSSASHESSSRVFIRRVSSLFNQGDACPLTLLGMKGVKIKCDE